MKKEIMKKELMLKIAHAAVAALLVGLLFIPYAQYENVLTTYNYTIFSGNGQPVLFIDETLKAIHFICIALAAAFTFCAFTGRRVPVLHFLLCVFMLIALVLMVFNSGGLLFRIIEDDNGDFIEKIMPHAGFFIYLILFLATLFLAPREKAKAVESADGDADQLA